MDLSLIHIQMCIRDSYYRIFNAVYMIYEEERTKKMISVIKRDGHRATYDLSLIHILFDEYIEKMYEIQEVER